ncbi:MAG: lactate racemase domain-containing protein [Chloroflexi bacterium]|nr:lactate racemase domain-containing protein [Chloroflexota bacterium]
MQIIRVPELEWEERRYLELPVPDEWDIEVCNIAGYNRPAMTENQIEQVIKSPLGIPPIRELAKGKKEVVILFDDTSRGTRPSNIIPFILKELAAAGIQDKNIRFICALGAHTPLDRKGIVAKLGEDIVRKYAIYNHNAFDNCILAGTTTYGTKVFVNAEYMQCDLRIAIASMVPHPFTVFGGGAKIILPGITSIETMMANHSLPLTPEERKNYDINSRRLDIEQAATFAGLNVLVECILNMWGDTVSLYAGAPVPVRKAAITESKKNYLSTRTKEKDIVILNAYHKASEAQVGMRIGADSVKKTGGDLVLIANAPTGQVQHYLMGSWGNLDERQYRNFKVARNKEPLPSNINHLIRYDEYPMLDSLTSMQPEEKIFRVSKWEDAMMILHKAHPGKATVAVYPNADTTYLE